MLYTSEYVVMMCAKGTPSVYRIHSSKSQAIA